MSEFRNALICSACLSLTAGCVSTVYNPGATDNPLNQLRIGQTYGDMDRILGKPDHSRIEDLTAGEIAILFIPGWNLVETIADFHPSALQICTYERFGHVTIDNNNHIVRVEANTHASGPSLAAAELAPKPQIPGALTYAGSAPQVAPAGQVGTLAESRPPNPKAASPVTEPSATDRSPSEIKIIEYRFDMSSKRGSLTIDIGDQGFEARLFVIKNIGNICSSKNVLLEAGKERFSGARYQVLNESIKEGLLKVEFEAVY